MSVLSVVERVVAWFLSWAIWNPIFVAETATNMWQAVEPAVMNVFTFWQEIEDIIVEQIWWGGMVKSVVLIFILWGCCIILLMLVLLLAISTVLLGMILLLYLSPLGAVIIGGSIWLCVKKPNTKRFFKQISWAFRETLKEEKKRKHKKNFRVVGKKIRKKG